MQKQPKTKYDATEPLKAMVDDFYATGRRYENPKAFARDALQLVIGLWNMALGVKNIFAGAFKLNGSQMRLGCANILRGLTQIITFPFALIRTLPRGLLTIKYLCTPEKPASNTPANIPTHIVLHDRLEKAREELLRQQQLALEEKKRKKAEAAWEIQSPHKAVTLDPKAPSPVTPRALNETTNGTIPQSPFHQVPTADNEIIVVSRPGSVMFYNLAAMEAAFPGAKGGIDVDAANLAIAGSVFKKVGAKQ